jgi:superfamily I DNA/RNA helicase
LGEAAVSVQGRGTVLRVNYRNTAEILASARTVIEQYEFYDLGPRSEQGIRDVEVIRSGPEPRQVAAGSREELVGRLCTAIADDHARGVTYGVMAVLTHNHIDAAFVRRHLARRQLPARDLASWDGAPDDLIKVDTTYRAKGLDFGAVYLPVFNRTSQDSTAPEQAERAVRQARSAFVGSTRARDQLWLGSVQ